MHYIETLESHLNPFSPRPAKTGPFIILLCLMTDDFTCQGRASGCRERVKPIKKQQINMFHCYLLTTFQPAIFKLWKFFQDAVARINRFWVHVPTQNNKIVRRSQLIDQLANMVSLDCSMGQIDIIWTIIFCMQLWQEDENKNITK